MNRSKCGSVFTDHFAVTAMSCNKLLLHYLCLFWLKGSGDLISAVAGLLREIFAVSVCSLPLGNVEGFFFLNCFRNCKCLLYYENACRK